MLWCGPSSRASLKTRHTRRHRIRLSVLDDASRASPGSCRLRPRHVWSHWFDQPPSPFDVLRDANGPGGVPWRAYTNDHSSIPGSNLGLHSRDRLGTFGFVRAGLASPALRRVLPDGPSDRSRSSLHSPTPPEVSLPSGDVTAGVRSTRDYHTRHLPPLIFLRSATAYSSNGLPVMFRTGTTYGFQRTRTSVAPLAVLSGLPSRTLPSWIARPGRAESRGTTAWFRHRLVAIHRHPMKEALHPEPG
jgi:hypothetical protein